MYTKCIVRLPQMLPRSSMKRLEGLCKVDYIKKVDKLYIYSRFFFYNYMGHLVLNPCQEN